MRFPLPRNTGVLAFATGLLASPLAIRAQTAPPSAIHATSPEVFEAIQQIYEYNRKALLSVDRFPRQDFPAYTRQKVAAERRR